MKDNFSTQSDKYAQYRPSYPKELIDYIVTLVPGRVRAWDCGTGNGQVAAQLVNYFDAVDATDISQSQLDNAAQHEKIIYSMQPAESTSFTADYFDCIVVAQAIHWFSFDKFYAEVNRTIRPGGILAVIGYGRICISAGIDAIITSFYTNIIGPYWDKERVYIDEHYQTIPFPFHEIKSPAFENKMEWNFQHLIGYLNTWSAVKHYIKENGTNPIDLIYLELKAGWGEADTKKTVCFPLLLRIGRIRKPGK